MTEQQTPPGSSQHVQDIESMFFDKVDVPLSGTRDQMIRGAAASLNVDTVKDRCLGEVIRGLSSMGGPAPLLSAYPSLIQSTIGAHMPETWHQVSQVTIAEALGWPSVGERKVVELISFLAPLPAGVAATVPPDGPPSRTSELLDALRTVAAWGVVAGHNDLPSALSAAAAGALESPLEAISAVMSTDLEWLAGDRVVWWDPDAAAEDLLAQFDQRETEVLRSRVLTGTRLPSQTLEQLGGKFGLTRERVRQIETDALGRLGSRLASDRYRSLEKAAELLRTKIGAACPISVADSGVVDNPDSMVDELYLWIAGPYHRSGGWVLRTEFATVGDLIYKAFAEISVDNITQRVLLLESASHEGLAPEHFNEALKVAVDVVEFRDHLVRWPRTTAERARTALLVLGVPMTVDELFEIETKVTNIRSFRNALYASGGLVRVGIHRWGLSEWGTDEYPGIVPAMVAEIETRGPLDVNGLAAELSDRYGVAVDSVTINASIHPVFVLEAGLVGLRSKDEPYVPKADLVDTAGCYVVDGAWALRVDVDENVLRGSGLAIPEAFAVHLGLEPMSTGQMQAQQRQVALSWGQRPVVGSIRRNVEALDLVLGDLVFIRRRTAGTLDFVGVRRSDIDAADSSAKVRLLIGAAGDDTRDVHLVVAEGLGMGLASTPSLAAVVSRLRSRGDTDLADRLEASQVESQVDSLGPPADFPEQPW